jgi:hypothetical protein
MGDGSSLTLSVVTVYEAILDSACTHRYTMLDDFTATDTLSALHAELYIRASILPPKGCDELSILNEDHNYGKFDEIKDVSTKVYCLYSISVDRKSAMPSFQKSGINKVRYLHKYPIWTYTHFFSIVKQSPNTGGNFRF